MEVVNVYATASTIEPCSRKDLLAFVNSFLGGKYKRIEELATGAAYCELTEILFPGKLPFKKVKLVSNRENDWIANWRVLQSVWDKIGVQKEVPVERLIRAKFQDNLEFLQWFKKFFDANYGGSWPDISDGSKSKTKQLKKDLIALGQKNIFLLDKLHQIDQLCRSAQSSFVLREEVVAILDEVKEDLVIIEGGPQVPVGAVGSNAEGAVDLGEQRFPKARCLSDSETY
ncbi:unnamed protein product [Gongylonema pulchrum]|uniref:Calponin-homology (CH) domain-containing protein n=1 Tax=Gongylonema pulchrum TaxID=637853 RepID=A0A183CVP2_9BILA|nr:unnamed protein product [Gongylonema pulchrum]